MRHCHFSGQLGLNIDKLNVCKMTNLNRMKMVLKFPYFPASSSILVITGLGDNLSPEVINLEGKTCSRLPEKYPKNVFGATGGFVNGQVIICGGYDSDATEDINECYIQAGLD